MTFSRFSLLSAGGVALVLGGGVPAMADTATDYFNDFGTTYGDLEGKSGSGTGWDGPWVNPRGLTQTPDYLPGDQLTYSATGYNNASNQSGANDGVATDDIDATAGQIVSRSMETQMSGTVWASVLMNTASETGDALLWFDKIANERNNFIAIRNGEAVLRFAGVDSVQGTYASNTTHLLLARIDLDVSGINDAIDLYINPDLSGGEAGLGTPDLSADGAEAFGSLITNISVSFEATGDRLDAIRISNDADGFAQVTAIPEPASVGLVALGGLAALRRRR